MTFVRLFIVPIGSTLSFYFFTDNINSFKSALTFFSVTFFLNWLADKTIISWSIKRGQRLTKEKENKSPQPHI